MTPEFWIVAGPNGAGKTTLVSKGPISQLLSHVVYWNPDDLARQILIERGFAGFADVPAAELRSAFVAAADLTFANLKSCLLQGLPCGVETVLSTNKYQELVNLALAGSGKFGLVYIGLRNSSIACDRVAQRVLQSGHDVPHDKVVARWKRSIENLHWFAMKAHRFLMFDNSSLDPAESGRLIAQGGEGKIRWHDASAIPELHAALREMPTLET